MGLAQSEAAWQNLLPSFIFEDKQDNVPEQNPAYLFVHSFWGLGMRSLVHVLASGHDKKVLSFPGRVSLL